MKKFFFAACSALLLAACADVSELSTEQKLVPISIDVYTQGYVRAYDATTATTLQNGFKLRITTGTGASAIDKTVDVTYDGTTCTLGEDIFWPVDGSQTVNFTAYYGATATDGVLSIDGSKDVIVATASTTLNANTSGTVALSFSHILSDVSVNVLSDNGAFTVAITDFSLSAPTNLDNYNLADGTWSSSNSVPASLFAKTSGNVTATASEIGSKVLVAPQEYTINASYTVTDGTATPKPFSRTAKVKIDPGTVNVINVTLPTSATSMGVSVSSVTAWPTTSTPTNVTVN